MTSNQKLARSIESILRGCAVRVPGAGAGHGRPRAAAAAARGAGALECSRRSGRLMIVAQRSGGKRCCAACLSGCALQSSGCSHEAKLITYRGGRGAAVGIGVLAICAIGLLGIMGGAGVCRRRPRAVLRRRIFSERSALRRARACRRLPPLAATRTTRTASFACRRRSSAPQASKKY